MGYVVQHRKIGQGLSPEAGQLVFQDSGRTSLSADQLLRMFLPCTCMYLRLHACCWQVGAQYKSAEVAKADWAAVAQSPPWAVDAWGLGCLMQEAFSGVELSRTEDLRNLDPIPKPVAQVRWGNISHKTWLRFDHACRASCLQLDASSDIQRCSGASNPMNSGNSGLCMHHFHHVVRAAARRRTTNACSLQRRPNDSTLPGWPNRACSRTSWWTRSPSWKIWRSRTRQRRTSFSNACPAQFQRSLSLWRSASCSPCWQVRRSDHVMGSRPGSAASYLLLHI